MILLKALSLRCLDIRLIEMNTKDLTEHNTAHVHMNSICIHPYMHLHREQKMNVTTSLHRHFGLLQAYSFLRFFFIIFMCNVCLHVGVCT